MRRIVLVLVLVVVLAIAGYMLLRPKGAPAKAKPSTALTDSTQFGTPAAKGKVAGKLKASTAADRTAKAKQIKDAERARKRDLARQARDKKRLLAKSARGRTGRSTGKGGGMYVLRAIVAAGNENYALVDSREVRVGDIVLGRKIVTIGADRIEIEAFGKQSTVRVGESLLPSSYIPTKGK